MAENDCDTETLIAVVSSLLEPNVTSTEAILEALIKTNGDVQKTVQLLCTNKKRKRSQLDTWLGQPQNSRAPFIPQSRRPPVSSNGRLPPLLLAHPETVAQHTPCTLHLSVLPPDLACRLFYTMTRASRNWKRNKWYLFERLVESPHRTSFFVRKDDKILSAEAGQEAAQYWYNGQKTGPPDVFPATMEEACEVVEKIVNEQLKQRNRLPLEWNGGSWRANVAASNCYEGSKESVGFHSDQLTYLGPHPTIASLSLGTQRLFSLREVIPTEEAESRKARTFNIPLPHNSLVIMHASCQEKFKHSVPPQPAIDLFRPSFPEEPGLKIEPSNCRINITFRFYRPDFQPPSTPRCKCGVPTVLRCDMKGRIDGKLNKYWWACYAGAQNEGKGCNYWKVMDMEAESRGPCFGISQSGNITPVVNKADVDHIICHQA